VTAAVEMAQQYARSHAQGSVPDYESLLERAYSRLLKPGHVVIDIGAHGGRHTEPFLAAVGPRGRVFAFEPLPHMASALSSRFSRISNCSVYAKALSRTPGRAAFTFVRNAPEESGLRRKAYNIPDPETETIQVPVSTLDKEFRWRWRLDYIKIDTEGAEIDVLEGGRNLIRRCSPIISVEYGRPAYSAYGHTAMTLYEQARSMGYVLGDLWGNPIRTPEAWQKVCDAAYWDYFMIPEARIDEWSRALKS